MDAYRAILSLVFYVKAWNSSSTNTNNSCGGCKCTGFHAVFGFHVLKVVTIFILMEITDYFCYMGKEEC